MTNLPLGTVRYSIGLEFNGRVGSMSEAHHTPLSIRATIQNYYRGLSFTKGLKLRIIKYRLVEGELVQGVRQKMWHANMNTDKKAQRWITI